MFFYRRYKNLNTKEIESHKGDRRSHLANERTFLAWIRTSVSIMAFGFLIEKFSLFLWMKVKMLDSNVSSSLTLSNLFGVVLIGLGVLLGLFALIHYVHIEREIETNSFKPSLMMDILCGLILFILSCMLFYYIINWQEILILNSIK